MPFVPWGFVDQVLNKEGLLGKGAPGDAWRLLQASGEGEAAGREKWSKRSVQWRLAVFIHDV